MLSLGVYLWGFSYEIASLLVVRHRDAHAGVAATIGTSPAHSMVAMGAAVRPG